MRRSWSDARARGIAASATITRTTMHIASTAMPPALRASIASGLPVPTARKRSEVPPRDRRAAVLLAGDTDRGGGQEDDPALARRQPEPARGQDPQRVAVAEDEDPSGRQPLGDQRVHAGAHVVGRLAARGAVAPQVP